MGATSSIGPISGIDYGKLLTGLTQSEQTQIDSLGKRLTTIDSKNNAILSLSALMTGLKVAATSFSTSAIFRTAAATSANPGVLTALAGIGTPTGNYSFNVQRLASASQQVTQGFADASNTALGLSGNITLQLGGGELDDNLALAELNGGSGVARGSIRITDKSGASTLLDLSHAVDVKDVVNTINSATGVNVQAKIDGDRFVITDNSGGAGTLLIANAGGTTTASDLGLTTAAFGATLTGNTLTRLAATTGLDTLNDGNGVRTAGSNDFSITSATGSVPINLATAKTVGDVIKAINTAGQSIGISAAVSTDGGGITLTDSGGGPITVAATNNSLAAYDLGILGSSATATLTGQRVASELTGPLLRNLNGGNQGQAGDVLPQPGTITINGETIDLSNASGLDQVIKTINTNSQGVTAALNQAGTGITLSSKSASFTVADGTGNLASFLHIAGAGAPTATGSQVASGDLRLRYLSDNTQLSTLNGGSGVKPGQIQITDGSGNFKTIDLSTADVTTMGAVLKKLNTSGLAITARINDTGDGILLTQSTTGAPAKVVELNGGSTAANLGILGIFSSNTLNGSFQKTIAISAGDKLSDIATKIANINPNIAASIINDGSGASPYRLSIASKNSGFNGRVIFDGSAIGLNSTALVAGQDAAVVYGGNANGTGGLLATNRSNTISGLIPSATITLSGVGNTTIAVNNDPSKVVSAVQGFVDAYNKVVSNIADVTKFDVNNPANNGVLFGNGTVQQVQNALGRFVTQGYSNVGSLHSLAEVGISVGQDGTLTLDTDKLNQKLATNPDDVRKLFTTNVKAVPSGPSNVTNTTLLSTLTGGNGFQAGHISITDGFGTPYDIDLSSISTVGDVITKINAGTTGKVLASINTGGTGLTLTQIGGALTPHVDEVSGGTTAASLGIKGNFNAGLLNGFFAPITPVNAVRGVGITLSDVLDAYTNGQTGQLFDASNAFLTQETQIKKRQTALSVMLASKKNAMILQFANLETTIAGLQSQGSSLNSIQSTTKA